MIPITRRPHAALFGLGGSRQLSVIPTTYMKPSEGQTEGSYGYTDEKCKQYREGVEREAMNDKAYWECSAADCNTIKQLIQDGKMTNDDCIAQGGQGEDPCTYLVHSCFSNTVCQMFNYWYGQGQFTQECGQYSRWAAQFTAGMFDYFATLFRCAFDKDDRPAFVRLKELASQLNIGIYAGYEESRAQLIQAWNDKRTELGLPAAEPYVMFEILQKAIMLSRGELPSLDTQIVDLVGGKATPHKPVAVAPPVGGGGVLVPMDDAILEFSLLGDQDGLAAPLKGVENTAVMSNGDKVRAGQFSPYGYIGTRWGSRLLPRPRPFEKTTWPDGTPIDPYWPPPEAPAGSDDALKYPFDVFKAISVFLEGNCLTCGPRKCGGATHDADMTMCATIGGNVLAALWAKYHRASTVILGLMTATCMEDYYNAHPEKRPKPGGAHTIVIPKRTGIVKPTSTAPTYPCPVDHPSYVLFGNKSSTTCKPEVAGGSAYPVYTPSKQRTSAWKCINGSTPVQIQSQPGKWVCGAPKILSLKPGVAKTFTIVPVVKRESPSGSNLARYGLIAAIALGIGIGGWMLMKRG